MSNERFDAFISYARVPSTRLASDLQEALQKFAKPWNRLRAIRVFRDDASMSANSGLWSTIERALQESDAFILLATPEAAASEYVNNEVAWWVRAKGSEHLLLAHCGGTIAWDRNAHDFTRDSSVPPALRGAFPEEPRWIDLSWFAAPNSLETEDPRFAERVADLSASIRGVERDTLIGENVRQHRKTVRLARMAIAGLSALLVLALAAAGVAFVQRSESITQRDAAKRQSLTARVGQVAATARDRAPSDLQSAMLLAASAYHTEPGLNTFRALHDVAGTTPQLLGFVDFGAPLTRVDATPDGSIVVGANESGEIIRVDRRTGDRDQVMNLQARVDFLAVSDDGETIAASGSPAAPDGSLGPDQSVSEMWTNGVRTEMPKVKLLALSPSGLTSATQPDQPWEADRTIEIRVNGKTTVLAAGRGQEPLEAVLPDDANLVLLTQGRAWTNSTIIRFSLPTGTITSENSYPPSDSTSTIWKQNFGAISGDGQRLALLDQTGQAVAWDIGTPPALAPPGKLGYFDNPALVADTGGGSLGTALNRSGTQIAVIGDGVIYVSDVRAPEVMRRTTALRGAGATPFSVRFIADTMLVSASGSAAALWDLTLTSPFGARIPVKLGDSSAFPPSVVVSPNAQKVLVFNDRYATLANLATGYSVRYESDPSRPPGQTGHPVPAPGTFDPAILAQPLAVWLDDDRLFIYAPSLENGTILGGERMDKVLASFRFPKAISAGRAIALRADGKLVVVNADGKLATIDPQTGSYQTSEVKATTLSPDGRYAIQAPRGLLEQSSELKVIDTFTDEIIVASDDIAGPLFDFVTVAEEKLFLLREIETSNGETADIEILAMELPGGSVSVIGRIGAEITEGTRTPLDINMPGVVEDPAPYAAGKEMYAVKSGKIVQYDLTTAEHIDLLPVASAAGAMTGLGMTRNGKNLVVANETSKSILRAPVAPDAFVKLACGLAGRSAKVGDLDPVVSELDGLQLGCQ